MRILVLEPFYGGSHKAFLDGLKAHSDHNWTILGLPAHKWKWRMRHAPLTFAQQVAELKSQKFDLLFCSDMLNLAEFKGLANTEFSQLPSIIYFHENQFTYPVQNENERDYHYAFSNFISAKTADAVWFNSQYHLDSFLHALESFLNRMPDYHSISEVKIIRDKSLVVYPGINPPIFKKKNQNYIPHILWNARWEFDKNPELFFEAMFQLQEDKYDFKLSVLGEDYKNKPAIFEKAKSVLNDKILNFGYLDSKEEYYQVLAESDIVVSTANHEFYGIAILEAAVYGAVPILPEKLSYPEIFKIDQNPDLFYDGSLESLCTLLKQNFNNLKELKYPDKNMNFLSDYFWDKIGNQVDTLVERLYKN